VKIPFQVKDRRGLMEKLCLGKSYKYL